VLVDDVFLHTKIALQMQHRVIGFVAFSWVVVRVLWNHLNFRSSKEQSVDVRVYSWYWLMTFLERVMSLFLHMRKIS